MENVDIHVVGIQRDCDGESDNIEIKTEARYCEKKNSTYLIYDESEITGMEGSKTKLRIEEDRIVMMRSGSVETKMEFVEGDKTDVVYKCPHGIFNMDVKTDEISVERFEDKISNISIKYTMCFDGGYETENCLYIKIL